MSSYEWPPQGSGSGSGVSSLNSLTGAITLVAGSGITVTPSGSNITIAATGGGSGTVTSVSVVSANGLAGTVATATTTPAITLSTSITGILQGNGTAISAATTGNLTDAGTDGIVVTGGTGAVLGSGTSLAQHVADTTHNGYLSSTDWNTFNGKQATLTIGNLTDAGTDGITITGGTGAVIGSGTSISQHVADTTHAGYLSSTDWNTFNGKQASGSYITALTGDGTASGPGSVALTLSTVNSNVGSFGSSTAIPSFTVNGKGLITAASTNVVVAPAGTLSGTTLNSTVVTSSLTSVGTIATGVWQGSVIQPAYIATLNQNTTGTAANITATSNSTLTTLSALSLPATQITGSVLSAPQIAVFTEVQTSGTSAGTFTSGAWQTRLLNTTQTSQSWASLASHQITLSSGTYYIEASAPALQVTQHQTKLRNITGPADVILGSSEYAFTSGGNCQSRSFVVGQFVVSGSTVYELQHQCSNTQATNGFGIDAGFGVNNIFAQVSITKIS